MPKDFSILPVSPEIRSNKSPLNENVLRHIVTAIYKAQCSFA